MPNENKPPEKGHVANFPTFETEFVHVGHEIFDALFCSNPGQGDDKIARVTETNRYSCQCTRDLHRCREKRPSAPMPDGGAGANDPQVVEQEQAHVVRIPDKSRPSWALPASVIVLYLSVRQLG